MGLLKENQDERRWGLGEECARAVGALGKLLDENEVPLDYKVAVIGRFKAGKSSFVNVLLDRRLAGVDTSPETAAITTFRHGAAVVANIHLVDKASWNELKQLYQADPADPGGPSRCQLVEIRERSPRRIGEPQQEAFDLDAIEREHVRPGGYALKITLNEATGAEGRRKAEAEFQRRIKQFTSSTKPHHCLVESIEIEAPSILLDEGVTLVDTPGLDDTERFRVQLTERARFRMWMRCCSSPSRAHHTGSLRKDFVLSLIA